MIRSMAIVGLMVFFVAVVTARSADYISVASETATFDKSASMRGKVHFVAVQDPAISNSPEFASEFAVAFEDDLGRTPIIVIIPPEKPELAECAFGKALITRLKQRKQRKKKVDGAPPSPPIFLTPQGLSEPINPLLQL